MGGCESRERPFLCVGARRAQLCGVDGSLAFCRRLLRHPVGKDTPLLLGECALSGSGWPGRRAVRLRTLAAQVRRTPAGADDAFFYPLRSLPLASAVCSGQLADSQRRLGAAVQYAPSRSCQEAWNGCVPASVHLTLRTMAER